MQCYSRMENENNMVFSWYLVVDILDGGACLGVTSCNEALLVSWMRLCGCGFLDAADLWQGVRGGGAGGCWMVLALSIK